MITRYRRIDHICDEPPCGWCFIEEIVDDREINQGTDEEYAEWLTNELKAESKKEIEPIKTDGSMDFLMNLLHETVDLNKEMMK